MRRFSIYTILLAATWLGLAGYFAYGYLFPKRDSPVVKVEYDPNKIPALCLIYDDYFYPKIPDELVESNPSWDYKNENPPISVRKVLEIAEDFRQKHLYQIKNTDAGYLSSIDLFAHSESDAKWCWCVGFHTRNTSGMAVLGHQVKFYVLMDGTVLPPLVHNGDLSAFERIQREWKENLLEWKEK